VSTLGILSSSFGSLDPRDPSCPPVVGASISESERQALLVLEAGLSCDASFRLPSDDQVIAIRVHR
jgi:hypothetical protein